MEVFGKGAGGMHAQYGKMEQGHGHCFLCRANCPQLLALMGSVEMSACCWIFTLCNGLVHSKMEEMRACQR